ncbi:universal stress protein [Chloroflexota bacterium]
MGRTGIGRWVFGSVTDKVLHAGDTPVLVVRAGKI